MKELFELASGTALGRNHRSIDRNNQDAITFYATDHAIACIVCDGCSDGKHNEVGAKIGARILCWEVVTLVNRTMKEYPKSADDFIVSQDFWNRIHQNILTHINSMVMAMGMSVSQTVRDFFLFTIVGMLITKNSTQTFALGDGVIMVNGEIFQMGPYPQNEPPYLGYNLTGTSSKMLPEFLKIQIIKTVSTKDMQTALIGTDGVLDFMKVADRRMPGKEELVGPISQFWEEDRYFNNPDMVRRKLFLTNNDSVKYIRGAGNAIQEIKKENGLLPDDTSLIVLRRKREERSA